MPEAKTTKESAQQSDNHTTQRTDPLDTSGDFCPLGSTHRPGDVVLKDGSTVRVRTMKPEDAEPLSALLAIVVGGITLAQVLFTRQRFRTRG